MSNEPKKHGKSVRESQSAKAHASKSQQNKERAKLDSSIGVTPLSIGRETYPDDLKLHDIVFGFELKKEISGGGSTESKRFFFGLRPSRQLVVLLFSFLLIYAILTHHKQEVKWAEWCFQKLLLVRPG